MGKVQTPLKNLGETLNPLWAIIALSVRNLEVKYKQSQDISEHFEILGYVLLKYKSQKDKLIQHKRKNEGENRLYWHKLLENQNK